MKLTLRTAIICLSLGTSLAAAQQMRSQTPTAEIPLHFEPATAVAAPILYQARAEGYAVGLGPAVAAVRTPESIVELLWLGADETAQLSPEEPLEGRSSYFLGRDPGAWRTNVPHYGRVRVSSLYPGIDAVYYAAGGRLEFDLVVSPGADPAQARLRFEGVDSVRLSPEGDLILSTPDGDLRQLFPRIYQETGDGRAEVAGRYVLLGAREAGFEIGDYDPAEPLVIDPVLEMSTYLGGSLLDAANAIEIGADHSRYVTGLSHSPDFPAKGYRAGPVTGNPPGNVFVVKLAPDGKTIVYSAFFGGAMTDYGNDIAVDVEGRAYITGYAMSADFPVSANAVQRQLGDVDFAWGDAFVTILNPAGSGLEYSTFLGGDQRDEGRGIALADRADANARYFVTGVTSSTAFPVTANAFQKIPGAAVGSDAFVTGYELTTLTYATYLGGENIDEGHGITADSSGNAYVTGKTLSPNFPTTAGVYSRTYKGGDQFFWHDAFVTKVRPDGSGLAYSTLLGGGRDDAGHAIALDESGNAVIAGYTASTDFPVTADAFQKVQGDGGVSTDAFVARLNTGGSEIVWATYLGGSGTDIAHGVAAALHSTVAVVGETDSGNFPTDSSTCEISLLSGGRDAFVTHLTANGAAMLSSALLGGTGADRAMDVAMDGGGIAYVAGHTDSPDFPTTPGALRPTASQLEGFVAYLGLGAFVDAPCCISLPGVVNAASYRGGSVAPGEIVSVFGKGIGPASLAAGQVVDGKFINKIADTQLLFDGVPSPLIYVYQTVISAVVPYAVAGKQFTEMKVVSGGLTSNTIRLPVVDSAPAIFAADATGQGPGAVRNYPSYALNTPADPIERGGIVMVFTTGEGQTSPAGVDGQLAPEAPPWPAPNLPVSLRIGGIETQVLYAGAAPGIVAGMMQVNAYVPTGVTPGDAVPVILKVGDKISQPGITIAVK